uniref:Transposase Helix-turn-helix domain-containing protein n=1 Tax=Amphimedon queenslandica TaxID=400682 RepID=A0A1X7SF63_AMPQE
MYDFVHQDLCQKSSLSPFQQLLMVLMRLRKNLQFDDLPYRFATHKTTISHLFNQLIEILYIKLKFLIV